MSFKSELKTSTSLFDSRYKTKIYIFMRAWVFICQQKTFFSNGILPQCKTRQSKRDSHQLHTVTTESTRTQKPRKRQLKYIRTHKYISCKLYRLAFLEIKLRPTARSLQTLHSFAGMAFLRLIMGTLPLELAFLTIMSREWYCHWLKFMFHHYLSTYLYFSRLGIEDATLNCFRYSSKNDWTSLNIE